MMLINPCQIERSLLMMDSFTVRHLDHEEIRSRKVE